MQNERLTNEIKAKAIELGFLGIAIAKAEHMDPEARRLEQWLNQGHHGEMSYLANHFDKRVDPTELVPGSKSVISLMYNYFSEDTQEDPRAPKIAMYAYGKDYHKVVKKKLTTLYRWINETYGEINGRCFVDSAPVLERDWARRSGLGWIGKHSLLVHPQKGSYFFLCEIILNLDLTYDLPIRDHCGTCTRCIDACPTDAISPDGYLMDASKCISYLTIELKGDIPETFSNQMQDWMFGCDICQQVCPWNRFSQQHTEPKFEPHPDLLSMHRSEWEEITEEIFDEIFVGSAVKRTKFTGLKRNIDFLKS